MKLIPSNNFDFSISENRAFHRAILTHGGTGSSPDDSDGPSSAAQLGLARMAKGQSALDAVVHAVRFLEDDARFNAGTGSHRRADNQTIQMDASCMSSEGQFGAVTCVEGVKNPINIAHGVLLHSDQILIAGRGARLFAQTNKIATQPLNDALTAHTQSNNAPSCDTVGAVAFDGSTFAAALSSGGLPQAVIGRVGDVPLPGCGLYCGPLGAVACTGDGEHIAMKMLAREVYGWIEGHMSPDNAGQKALTLFEDAVDIGLIILTQKRFASYASNDMAWSHFTAYQNPTVYHGFKTETMEAHTVDKMGRGDAR